MVHSRLRLTPFFVFLFAYSLHAQQLFTESGLETEVLAFRPIQKAGVDAAAFDKASMMLEGTRDATKGIPSNFNVADYWNITVAFCHLNLSAADISLAFSKAAKSDAASLCSYIKAFGGKGIRAKIPEAFDAFLSTCNTETNRNKAIPEKDSSLDALMQQINAWDQYYRSSKNPDLQKQALLDARNAALIDSLYLKYGTYIGSQLVDQDLEHVMWAVVQHSNLEMMEKYLPIVDEATKEGHLSKVTPLKMLIDRIYSLKYGKQIFGSQEDVPLASPEIRNKVGSQYGFK